ncbi:hypothetical protein G9A89_015798 [Geosiphon pyriformis]|nr:hypothetical protein G9A89_015798 [Geosiphon pyriformis]
MGQFTYSARAKAEEVLRQALDSIAAEDTNLKYQVQKLLCNLNRCLCSRSTENFWKDLHAQEEKMEVHKKMMIVDKAKLKFIVSSYFYTNLLNFGFSNILFAFRQLARSRLSLDGKDEFNHREPNTDEIATIKNYANNKEDKEDEEDEEDEEDKKDEKDKEDEKDEEDEEDKENKKENDDDEKDEEEEVLIKENKTGPFRLDKKNQQEIQNTFKLMKKKRMWRLSSGRYVEEELYALGKKLKYEHAAHSFIIDVDDEAIKQHFNKGELDEIIHTHIPPVPQLAEDTELKEIRSILKEITFGTDYNYEKHHDVDYICFALHALISEIESKKLEETNLENWFNCHIWSIIVDQCFSNVEGLSVVRGERVRQKIGHRSDWILRSIGSGEKDEYGAGEAGRYCIDRHGTKFLREIGLKLPKILKDMVIKLMEKVDWDEEKCSRIQTVGIIHGGLMMTMLYLDKPKGYICRVRRSDSMEVPDKAGKFPSVLTILASILNAKAVVRETIKAVQPKGPTIQSLEEAGLQKRFRNENQCHLYMCMPTPKKAKVQV